MKKVALTAVALFTFIGLTQAQEFGFKKGSKLVEGNIHLDYFSDKSYGENTRVSIVSPTFGYFISDKIAVGAHLWFSDIKEENTLNDSHSETHGHGLDLFGRYYFLELGKRFKTYAELRMGYGNSHYNDLENGIENASPDYLSYSTSGNIGFNYFITKRLSINYVLNELVYWRTSKVQTSNGARDNEFVLQLNRFNNIFSDASFGLSYKF